MRRTWAAAAAMVMTTVLGARSSQAQSAPAGSAAAPAPTVAGNSVVIPVPSASATVAGPSATVVAPSATVAGSPPMLMVPQPASANGKVPDGYVMLVPWTPPVARPEVRTEPATIERSYAWKLAITDVTALALAFVSLPTDSLNPARVSLAVYALGAPIVHLGHNNGAKGLASFALRVAMPVGGVYIGALGCLLAVSTKSNNDFGDLGTCAVAAGVGALAGLGGALAIDYTFLAKEKVSVEPTRTVRWSPSVMPRKDGMTLGVVGAW